MASPPPLPRPQAPTSRVFISLLLPLPLRSTTLISSHETSMWNAVGRLCLTPCRSIRSFLCLLLQTSCCTCAALSPHLRSLDKLSRCHTVLQAYDIPRRRPDRGLCLRLHVQIRRLFPVTLAPLRMTLNCCPLYELSRNSFVCFFLERQLNANSLCANLPDVNGFNLASLLWTFIPHCFDLSPESIPAKSTFESIW